jgi:hypothetical protein
MNATGMSGARMQGRALILAGRQTECNLCPAVLTRNGCEGYSDWLASCLYAPDSPHNSTP